MTTYDINPGATLADIQTIINRTGNDDGQVTIAPGTYARGAGNIDTITLASNTQVIGAGPKTVLEINGGIGVTTATPFITGAALQNLTIKNVASSPADTDEAIRIVSMNYSLFSDLYFENYANGIICRIRPAAVSGGGTGEQLNVMFNEFRRWKIPECRLGVIYEGKYGTTGSNGIAEITNNSWYNITFRLIRESAVYAVQWVDSERWYSLYAQANTNGAVILSLGQSIAAGEDKQVDKLFFYSPTLVFNATASTIAAAITAGTLNLVAIRLGCDTRACAFHDVITDKNWNTNNNIPVSQATNSFFRDLGAVNYMLHMAENGNGVGPHGGQVVWTKGLRTSNSGTSTILAGAENVLVDPGVIRDTEAGEVVYAPVSPVGDTYFLGPAGNTTFYIKTGIPAPANLKFNWSAQLKTFKSPQLILDRAIKSQYTQVF